MQQGWAADLWQDEELADLDVVLAVEPDTGGDKSSKDTNNSSTPPQQQQLCKMPGHRILLCRSPFLKAQVLRWQRKRPAQEQPQSQQQPKRTSRSRNQQQQQQQLDQAANTPLPDDDRPQVVLTLQDAAQEPAARAVLASLYDKPLPELLSGLSQEQQLSAVVLADMWDVPAFSAAAAAALAKAAESQAGLEHTVSSQLLAMPALPSCLLPVVEAVLLPTYGDLEAVWRDVQLQKQLLALPLPAMEALLSSSKLKAASEDTVLYTAQRFVDSIQDEQQQQIAREQLAPLIRCPHLSLCWLAASVNPAAGGSPLLHELSEHIWKLMMCRHADPTYKLTAAEVQKCVPAAPPSWSLPARPTVLVDSVELAWSLPVSELRAAALEAARWEAGYIISPHVSPPLRGLTWRLRVQLQSEAGSVTVGLYAVANFPFGMCGRYKYSISVPQADISADGHELTHEPGSGWGLVLGSWPMWCAPLVWHACCARLAREPIFCLQLLSSQFEDVEFVQ